MDKVHPCIGLRDSDVALIARPYPVELLHGRYPKRRSRVPQCLQQLRGAALDFLLFSVHDGAYKIKTDIRIDSQSARECTSVAIRFSNLFFANFF